jgi:signal transduction histidine kinase
LTFEFIKEQPEEDNLIFKIDSEKLRLILSNLVDNAIKFSKNNKIVVKRWIENNTLFVSVQDFGIGISDNNQKIIFDRFKRLDSGINSLNRGHGLGLSINKALLDFLNGTIDISSKKSFGTTFLVSIPEALEDPEGYSADGNEMLFGVDEVF